MSRSNWVDKDPGNEADVRAASEDFLLRENSEGKEDYLSLYEVSDMEEGCRAAAAFRLTSMSRTDKVDFLVFPRTLFEDAGIDLAQIPMADLCEFLSCRHLGTIGPRHEPDSELVRRIMIAAKDTVVRLRKADIKRLAGSLLEVIPDLHDRMGPFWKGQISNKGNTTGQ